MGNENSFFREESVPNPEEEINKGRTELPADMRPRPITELYRSFADTIEAHPNYQSRKGIATSSDVTLEQFVAYCRERAEENYTNETERSAQRRFQKYYDLLR